MTENDMMWIFSEFYSRPNGEKEPTITKPLNLTLTLSRAMKQKIKNSYLYFMYTLKELCHAIFAPL